MTSYLRAQAPTRRVRRRPKRLAVAAPVRRAAVAAAEVREAAVRPVLVLVLVPALALAAQRLVADVAPAAARRRRRSRAASIDPTTRARRGQKCRATTRSGAAVGTSSTSPSIRRTPTSF